MAKITFLGSCREVGRSAIQVESKNGDKFLLDYGIRFREEERLPQKSDLTQLKGVALTHCHVDHSGALPYLYLHGKSPPLFTNGLTLDIIDNLIKDTLKISKYPYPFGLKEIDNMKRNAYLLPIRARKKVSDNFYITFYDAGHVPGSVSILLEVDGKKILYTGDFNTKKTNLVDSANPLDIPDIDAVIVESTYALREHPPRDQLEQRFVEDVIEITQNGGTVLVPAFAVARSQEAIMILNRHRYREKVFLDGMGKLIAKIYFDYPEALKNRHFYRKALRNVDFVSRRKKRSVARKSTGVIVTTSGMLKGGAALEYIETILNDPYSAIYLVGYQVEGTPGRDLLDTGVFRFRENDRQRKTGYDINIKAQCEVDYYDFSSHADGKGLHTYMDNLTFSNGSKEVFCVHGDSDSTTKFASELVAKGFNSVAPETGETYVI
ncbi:MAG: Ribonuclease [Promethearchaeota archaeon]|nr:MAG: Ribonuclease [Candidatus Lokiarchaeota archaeon]